MQQEPLVAHWSYSAMSSLLNNPMAFKKKYVLKLYDDLTSPTGLVGNAGHKALEMYFKGMPVEQAVLEGQKVIDQQSDMGIQYGKTGTRAGIIETYNKAINFYFDELPTFHELLGVEENILEEIESITGGKMALPAKAKIDILSRNKRGEIEVLDHKFVYNYSDPEVDDFKKWLQGMFNYYAVKAKYGEWPARIIYNECKTSKNKDGSPQIRPLVMEFSEADKATFEKLYNDCTAYVSRPDQLFLPNPNDIFDGNNTFELYRSGVMDVEAPRSVKKRTEEREFVEKFTPAPLNTADYKDMSMEERIRIKLQEFGARVEMKETHVGPSVTQYTMQPGRAVPMSKIARMGNDLALALEAPSLRIEAPIPGTGLVGVEVPSTVRRTVELVENHMHQGSLDIPIGVNVFNEVVYRSLADMPHLLVAGATGSGKSVMLNVIIKTLTAQLTPEALQLVLVDPKQVEFAPFENLPHLALPVVYDNKGAAEVLAATVTEMEERYKKLRRRNVRNIAEYNKKGNPMPYRVIILDEFADLMMTAEKTPVSQIDIGLLIDNLEYAMSQGNGRITKKAMKAAIAATLDDGIAPAEESIIRIAQKARAVGIHLVLATQRPSADVVTGLIKANIPTKIAFMTTSKVNSQIILDQPGAEELTGKGDMLFSPSDSAPQRLQGLYA
jgi:hypothetical protein